MARVIYMDVHVPAAITAGLRRLGMTVITSQEDGTNQFDDVELLTRATQLGCILLSQDSDLLAIAQEWQSVGHAFGGLLFAHQAGASIGRLIEDIELIVSCARDEELSNSVIYLPLR